MGITGLSQNINKLEQGQYNDRGINVIREFKDRGIRVWGARTLATKSDPSWKYINVRRLFIMIEQSIMLGSQWSVFEPNDQTLWKKLTRDVRSYLMRVWRSGALFGATAEEAFYVKCDSETNPRYLIDAGQVNVQVGISPVKPAEFVVFSIGQWDVEPYRGLIPFTIQPRLRRPTTQQVSTQNSWSKKCLQKNCLVLITSSWKSKGSSMTIKLLSADLNPFPE